MERIFISDIWKLVFEQCDTLTLSRYAPDRSCVFLIRDPGRKSCRIEIFRLEIRCS
jgi:hypothetical protein